MGHDGDEDEVILVEVVHDGHCVFHSLVEVEAHRAVVVVVVVVVACRGLRKVDVEARHAVVVASGLMEVEAEARR